MKCFTRLFLISLFSCPTIIFYSCGDSPSATENGGVKPTFAIPNTTFPTEDSSTTTASGSVTSTLVISGMTCHSCVSSIQGALSNNSLVKQIKCDHQTKKCIINYDKKLSMKDIIKTIVDTGFRVDSVE